jgi:hypothetical protein
LVTVGTSLETNCDQSKVIDEVTPPTIAIQFLLASHANAIAPSLATRKAVSERHAKAVMAALR